MKFFKVLFIFICVFSSVQIFAQINIGIKGGVNFANMMFDIDSQIGDEPPTTNRPGVRLGLIADIPIVENVFSLQSGAFFSSKGYTLDVEELYEDLGVAVDNYEGFARTSYNYIEVPLNLTYKSNGLHFFAGPYLAFGTGGIFSHDFSFESGGIEFESDDLLGDASIVQAVFGEVGNDEYEDFLDDDKLVELYRGFDYGLNLGLGYQVNNVLFSFEYSVGMGNITPTYSADDWGVDEEFTDGYLQRNRVFSVSLAYFFNQKSMIEE